MEDEEVLRLAINGGTTEPPFIVLFQHLHTTSSSGLAFAGWVRVSRYRGHHLVAVKWTLDHFDEEVRQQGAQVVALDGSDVQVAQEPGARFQNPYSAWADFNKANRKSSGTFLRSDPKYRC